MAAAANISLWGSWASCFCHLSRSKPYVVGANLMTLLHNISHQRKIVKCVCKLFLYVLESTTFTNIKIQIPCVKIAVTNDILDCVLIQILKELYHA